MKPAARRATYKDVTIYEFNEVAMTEQETQQPISSDRDELQKQIENLTAQINALPQAIEDVLNKREVQSKDQIMTLIDKRLQSYSTTRQTLNIVSSSIDGLRDEIKTWTTDVKSMFEDSINAMNQTSDRLTKQFFKTQSDVNHHDNEISLLQAEVRNNKVITNKLLTQNEAILPTITRIDANIRGDGENDGLVGKLKQAQYDVKRIERQQAQDQAYVRQVDEKADAINAGIQYLKAKEEQRERRNERIIESAKFVGKYGGPAAVTLGPVVAAILSVLWALLQALLGGGV